MSSHKIKNRFAFAAFLLVAVFVRAELKVGDAVPAFSAAGVVRLGDGEVPATSGQVVLLDFWASWCAPCKASFPAMAKLHQDYAARGLVIAAVSVDEKASAATAFARKLAPPFATLHDRDQKLASLAALPAMPTSYLIGRDGRVRFIHTGFHGDATVKELRTQIETLLAEKK